MRAARAEPPHDHLIWRTDEFREHAYGVETAPRALAFWLGTAPDDGSRRALHGGSFDGEAAPRFERRRSVVARLSQRVRADRRALDADNSGELWLTRSRVASLQRPQCAHVAAVARALPARFARP